LDLHSVLFAPRAEQVDMLAADLYERGTVGLSEEDALLRAFFEDDADYSDLLPRYPVLEMRREDVNTAPAEYQPCDPIFAGEKFFIVPAASTEPTPPGCYRLTIHETAAFGTGRHETTQLMLAALENTLQRAQRVLDVGAGSGILSDAARLLGAARVWSCDIYDTGLRTEGRDLRSIFIGSVDAVADAAVDLTLANITPRVLDAIAHDLKRVTAPGGRILISGFLSDAVPSRFKPLRSWEQDGWLCWLCDRDGIEAGEAPRGIVVHEQNWW
jgi:ribosomal protein L11 methylase PrmA